MKKIILYLILPSITLGLNNCAKMGSLTGGPKDEDPPRVVSSIPENYSLNFDKDRIEITFDEFIQLDNVNQELVVSPPIGAKPDVRLRNKSIFIEIESDLRENTTYTLNFGEAIKDNNEGNLLSNFEFVFSTGNYLDSLSIGGTLLNAFDLKPLEDPVMIMLYDNLSDSVVFKELPVYIGKTGEEGAYRINNLKSDTFKLFALKDVNNNFLFDLPNEQIAFLDSTVIIDPEFFSKIVEQEKDSTLNDSLLIVASDTLEFPPPDTLERIEQDSLDLEEENLMPDQIMIDLFLFTENNETQFLADYDRPLRYKLEFNFNLPVTDSFQYRSLVPADEKWYLEEISSDRDSFIFWVIRDEIARMDSIPVEMKYVITDSMNQKVWTTDTLLFTFREPAKASRKKEEEKKENILEIQTFKPRALLDLNEKTKFLSTTPVNYVDTSRVIFNKIVDTLEIREPYNMFKDSTHLRKVVFDKNWESEAKYHFTAYPGTFLDVYGNTNDTIDVRFSIRDEGYYGTLIVNLDTIPMPLVVQLMSPRDELIREKYVTEVSETRFPFLKPDKYKIKIIYDRNNNREWDTGKYIKKIQPEKVQFYQGDIDVRANWELEIKVETMKILPGEYK